MRNLMFVIGVLLVSVFAAHAQDSTTWTVDGIERTYTLYVPDGIDAPAPLVIVLHGRFGDGEGMREYSQFDRVADDEGFVVAYPDGLDGEWNYTRGIPGYDDLHDDTAFLIALIDHIAEDHDIDLTRVYLAGMSNGGFMVQRVACENPARFAGFASVAASGFGGMIEVCSSELPAPMLMIHGTADTNIPWEGTPVTRSGQTIYITYPVSETFGYWAAANRCEAQGETTEIPASDAETSVRVLTLTCPEESPVVLYGIIGGGHNWARPDLEPYPASGAINHDIDTAREIWKFFAPLSRDAS